MNRKILDKLLTENKAEMLITYSPQTRLWATGIASSDGLLIIEKNETHLFVDGRYIEYAQQSANIGVEVHLLQRESILKFFISKAYQTVLIEREYTTIQQLDWLSNYLPENVKRIEIDGQKLRIVKTEEEIKLIQKAIDISLQAYNEVKESLEIGQTEIEVAALLNYKMRLLGADKESFDPIVAFGPSSAEPHHHPTNRTLTDGTIVKLDFGAQYKGFAADITRTFLFEKEEKADPELGKILQIVKDSAIAGITKVKPGVLTSDIDKACRDYIKAKGYHKQFVHSTGHGLGIDVHELPNVGANNGVVLEPGMVITVEPGIYIPGLGGARVENDILVTEDGYINLSEQEGDWD